MNFREEGGIPMKSNRISRITLPLGLAGALAMALAAGAVLSEGAVAKPAPDRTAAEAQKALAKGQVDTAIQLAESIVAANPRDASYRALLGQAYLRAGRFESAATALNDAMKLGDNGAKTALGLSLAYSGVGRGQEAVAILNDWRDAIPASDLGLAMALSGETSRGVAILSDALRAGDSSAKLRQNLAYAYALDGRWRDARVMAAMDVPADQLDTRLSGWAAQAKPEDSKQRIASLLGVPLRADPGQPTALALGDGTGQQFAAENASRQPAPPTGGELPPASAESAAALAQYQPVEAPRGSVDSFTGAPLPTVPVPAAPAAEPAPVAQPAPRPVARAAVAVAAPAPVSAHLAAPRSRQVAAVASTRKPGHAVQLGSFSSEQGARRAWGIYTARNPELRNFRMTITPATVRGKRFWRVAAAGLDGPGAGSLCGKVKSRGGACFAYRTPPATPGRPVGAAVMARAAIKPKPPAVARVVKAKVADPGKGPSGPSNVRRK